MAFDIPDQDLAFNQDQSRWMSTDVDILVAAFAGTGVLTGCDVTPQGTPDMTVAVAAGTVQPLHGSASASVAGGNVTIGAADATNPRIDLITSSAAGVKTITAGTAAANPRVPNLPAGHIALAAVYVPATDTAIAANQITDKRVVVAAGGGSALTVKDEGSTLATAATTLDFTGSGVTASGTGAAKTINIPGGGGSGSPTVDAAGKVYAYSAFR